MTKTQEDKTTMVRCGQLRDRDYFNSNGISVPMKITNTKRAAIAGDKSQVELMYQHIQNREQKKTWLHACSACDIRPAWSVRTWTWQSAQEMSAPMMMVITTATDASTARALHPLGKSSYLNWVQLRNNLHTNWCFWRSCTVHFLQVYKHMEKEKRGFRFGTDLFSWMLSYLEVSH